MSQAISTTLETFSLRRDGQHYDEIEVEYYPEGGIKVRITKYNSRGEYQKHASLILTGREIENVARAIRRGE